MRRSSPAADAAMGFAAGFLATLVFHQLTAAALAVAGLSPTWPYQTRPVPPFGVPQVLSLAFWGGLWGILYPFLLPRLPGGLPRWLWAIVVGAVGPSLSAWFVVAPLKGLPPMAGGNPLGIARGLVVNGMWGLGTFVFLRAFEHLPSARPSRVSR